MKYKSESIIFGTVVLASLVYVFFFKEDERKKIMKEGAELVIGRIIKAYVPPRTTGVNITYIYELGGKEMEGTRNVMNVINSSQRFVNKFFPVMVSKEDSDRSAILITPKDFSFFNKEFPDSLTWVVQWVDESQHN